MQTNEARVAGLGSARDGTGHWWLQRLTAIALVPLAIAFLVPFIGVADGDWQSARALYAQPFHAVVAMLFIGTAIYHLALGLRVVIEDYVHHGVWKTALLIGNALGCSLLGVVGIFSIAALAFSG